jgi:hypothetical protein
MTAQPAGSLFKALIERAIVGCDDPSERRERVEIAREEGVFSPVEAAEWLGALGLEVAA